MSTTASGTGPTANIAHPSTSSVKVPLPAGSNSESGPTTPITRHGSLSSTFGSPSSLRAEEDILVIEVGTRKVSVGFAGDAAPRCRIWIGPESGTRTGDIRAYLPPENESGPPRWQRRAAEWGRDHELWQFDLRGLDLGLVGDKLERALREALTKYMLIDSRPRRVVFVLPSGLPLPMLSTILDMLFHRFQPPFASLLSAPVMVAVGAGVRAALVVDLGWTETVVSALCDYRIMHSCSSVRGGRMLVEQTHNLLAMQLARCRGQTYEDPQDSPPKYLVSFEECEDIATRLLWCKPIPPPPSTIQGLATLDEEDESPDKTTTISIPLTSCQPPTTISLPLQDLILPCETTFFSPEYTRASFDDDEQPISTLVYRALLALPIDARALCMSRIIFTGGCANVLGLRKRIFDEAARLVQTRGWDPVQGAQYKKMAGKTGAGSRVAGQGPVAVPAQEGDQERAHEHAVTQTSEDGVIYRDAAKAPPELDSIMEEITCASGPADVHEKGRLRAIESLGAWAGASLAAAYLKIQAVATVDRDMWLAHGVAGASRASDVDFTAAFRAQQRQSMASGAHSRGAGGSIGGGATVAAGGGTGVTWTLGIWGNKLSVGASSVQGA